MSSSPSNPHQACQGRPSYGHFLWTAATQWAAQEEGAQIREKSLASCTHPTPPGSRSSQEEHCGAALDMAAADGTLAWVAVANPKVWAQNQPGHLASWTLKEKMLQNQRLHYPCVQTGQDWLTEGARLLQTQMHYGETCITDNQGDTGVRIWAK